MRGPCCCCSWWTQHQADARLAGVAVPPAVRNELVGTGVKIGVVNPAGVRAHNVFQTPRPLSRSILACAVTDDTGAATQVQTEWFEDEAKGGHTSDRPDTSRFLDVDEVVDAMLLIIDQAETTDCRRIVLENVK